MLLPDQTYADYVVGRHQLLTYHKSRSRGLKSKLQRSKSSDASSSSYERTADFFENIPDFHGESLPTFLYSPSVEQDAQAKGDAVRLEREDEDEDQDSESTSQSDDCEDDDVLRLCEDFLCRHRMRPDFFCQYHKAVSSTTPSPKQTKTSTPIVQCKSASPPGKVQADIKDLKVNRTSAVVERFAKFSAIYTLPVPKRKKACNKTTGNITGKTKLLNSLSKQMCL
ncbi:GD23546 [Drosophila simulans]|uniref:GD23546 n=1 Tax=Drosophila simulans TaxID=7240 RepID=B4Q6U9_DROSI|nr:GD23546 [Drosophila simulans]